MVGALTKVVAIALMLIMISMGSAFADSTISETAFILAQEKCTQAAEAQGYTVESIISTDAEGLSNFKGANQQAVIVLGLQKAGNDYRFTCPFTVEEGKVISLATNVRRNIASDPSQSPISSSGFSWLGWFFFFLLLGLFFWLWSWFRKSKEARSPHADVSSLQFPNVVQADLVSSSENGQSRGAAKAAIMDSVAELASASKESAPQLEAGVGVKEVAFGSIGSTDVLEIPLMQSKDTDPTKPEVTAGSQLEDDVIQVIEEEMTLGTQLIERGRVRVIKRVETREEVLDAPIVRDLIVVEHVPVNRLIEDGEIPAEREEGQVLIVPVFEEVVVSENRLFLREEVHIFKRQMTDQVTQQVQLRQEQIELERSPFGGHEAFVGSVTATTSPTMQLVTPTSSSEETLQTVEVAAGSASASDVPGSSTDSLTDPFADEPMPPASVVDDSEEIVIPVVVEEAFLQAKQVPREKVYVHKRVQTRGEVINTSAMYEQLVIEHVPINQFVEGTPPTEREESGVRIIPILEEIVVNTTKLLLKEELHISRQQTTEIIPTKVTLRRDVVEIEETSSESEKT
jgi:uncharacterized protein (TIGR02271 family)